MRHHASSVPLVTLDEGWSAAPQATRESSGHPASHHALAESERAAAPERLKIPDAPLAQVEPALQLFEIVARATVPAGEDEPVAHKCLPFEPVTGVTLWEENKRLEPGLATLQLMIG
jgi:hypothetical protein